MTRIIGTTTAISLIIALAACESSGGSRIASVGAVGPQGASGAQGEAGATGATGQTGAPGTPGADGQQGPSGFALNDTGMIATGGLIGANGVAGTGLLANIGDPSTSIPGVSDASFKAGSGVTSLSSQLDGALGQIDQTGTLSPITSAATGTLGNVGGALAAYGSDGAPLVDGLMASASPLVNASVGGGAIAGDSSSLLGVSVLSANQNPGTLGEVGVVSGGSLLNADFSPTTDTGLSVGGLANVDLGPVTSELGNVNDPSSLTDNVEGLLTDVGLPTSPEDNPVTSGVGGLLGKLGLK